MRGYTPRSLCFPFPGQFRLVAACCLLLLPGHVHAQTSVPSPSVDGFAQDGRMALKVKVQAPGLAVKDLLARLSQATGVKLTADKITGEDKVIVFSSARPLQATLADVAALFNDTWRRDVASDGRPRYLLTRSSRAVSLEENLLSKSRNRLITQLEAQVNALSETQEQLAKRPADDPIRKNLSVAENRAATQVYAALTPEQREQLFSRRYLNFAANAINPQMREPITKVAEESMRFVARFRQPGDGSPKETAEDYMRRGVQFAIHTSGGHVIPAVQVYGKGTMHAALFAELDARKQWMLPLHGNPYAPSPSAFKSLPDVEQVEKAFGENLWVDRLQKLAVQSGKPVIADFYRSQAINVVPSEQTGQGNAPAQASKTAPPPADPARISAPAIAADTDKIAALDTLCRPVGYLWWTRTDGALLLRKRDWYEQRLYETPEDWLQEAVKRMAAQNNVPTLADFCRARELTDQQIVGLNSLYTSENFSFSEVEFGGTSALLGLLDRQLSASPVYHQPMLRGRTQQGIVKFEGDSLLTAREILQEFLTAQTKPILPADIKFFRVDAYVVDTTVPEGGFKNAELTMMWNVGDGGAQQQSIRLPYRLPNNGQAATEIATETEKN